jgi:hypothetical protein
MFIDNVKSPANLEDNQDVTQTAIIQLMWAFFGFGCNETRVRNEILAAIDTHGFNASLTELRNHDANMPRFACN